MEAPKFAVKFDTPLTGCVVVVEESKVELLTREGWKVIAFYQETQMMPCQEQNPPANDRTYPISYTTYKPSTFTKFVMHLDEESTLAQAAASVRSHQQAAVISKNELGQAKKELEEATKRDAMTKNELERVQRTRDTYQDDLIAVRASNRKLEGDIAKIRKAVGELKLKEILE